MDEDVAVLGQMQCTGCTAATRPLLTCCLDCQGDVHAAADLPRKGVEVGQPLVLAEALHRALLLSDLCQWLIWLHMVIWRTAWSCSRPMAIDKQVTCLPSPMT